MNGVAARMLPKEKLRKNLEEIKDSGPRPVYGAACTRNSAKRLLEKMVQRGCSALVGSAAVKAPVGSCPMSVNVDAFRHFE